MQIERVAATIQARGGMLALVSVFVLLVSSIALIAIPRSVELLTGKGDTPRLSAPDELPAASRDDPTTFLLSRDELEIQVHTTMTVRELLDLNRLNKPNLRKQVMEQLGNPALDAKVTAGTTLKLHLTPRASDVPGTAPPAAR